VGSAKILPANPSAIFLPSQARWISDKSRLKLAQKGRQLGFTWAAAYEAVEETAVAGARFDHWISSRDEIQAKLFLVDGKLWAKAADIAARDLGEQVLDADAKHSAFVLRFPNGRNINCMSSNPDAQAGKRGSRLLDEFALHPDPRKLWTIAYPGITWGGSLKVISTHRGSKNFFNQLVREVTEGGNPKGISLHTVTLQNALDEGFLWKLQQNLAPEDERQLMDEAAYFDWVKAGCADEESFLQEYMCQPADDDAAFLEYDLIASAEYAEGTNWRECEGDGLYLGVDIGRKHDLTVLWVLEKLGDVVYTRHVEGLKNMSKGDQEKIIWPWIEKCKRTCIDYTALGIGWGDDAVARFGKYKVENVTFTPKVKEALAYPVRGLMEDKRLRIPYDPKVRADFRSITKQVTTAGNIRFTAERTVDGHADHFWSLALAVHAAYGLPGNPWRPLNPREVQTELDENWVPA
jgi:phage FluMu gp28-like protein